MDFFALLSLFWLTYFVFHGFWVPLWQSWKAFLTFFWFARVLYTVVQINLCKSIVLCHFKFYYINDVHNLRILGLFMFGFGLGILVVFVFSKTFFGFFKKQKDKNIILAFLFLYNFCFWFLHFFLRNYELFWLVSREVCHWICALLIAKLAYWSCEGTHFLTWASIKSCTIIIVCIKLVFTVGILVFLLDFECVERVFWKKKNIFFYKFICRTL